MTTCPNCARTLRRRTRFCPGCGQFVANLRPDDRALRTELQAALGPDFEVIKEIGTGNFSIVYAVRDLSRRQDLGVKVLRPDLTDSRQALNRFKREIEYVDKLLHPNILPIYFYAVQTRLAYYAMPLISGETLQTRLRRDGRLPITDVCRLMDILAQGLDHAHAKGIVHRDVKPANILIDRLERPILLDFGVAKALISDETGISVSGELVGTLAYMSPEQLDGGGLVDHRSDLYSWGVVAFEMLTGRPPFEGVSPHQLMYDHFNTTAPDVREFRAEVPVDVATSLARCLEKDPCIRWSSLREASQAMRTLIKR